MHKEPTENPSPSQDGQLDDEQFASTDGNAITRRSFVKASSSILLAKGVSACGDGTGTTATGTIRLLLAGLHPAALNGGTATATPTGGGTSIAISIPAIGDQTAAAPVGDYTVLYTPPASHQLAAGQQNPRTIAIQEGVTTTVGITLVAVGSLQITVTGITGSPPNGGSAVAQRTDAAGTPIAINISAAGSGTAANVPVGTYTVTYTPPSGSTVSGTNPVTGLAVNLGVAALVEFSLAQQPQLGSVRVTVSGLTGASAGGSATARLTSNTGSIFSVTLPAPTGGTSIGDLVGLPAGSYNVTYSPPSGFAVTGGGTTVATVTANTSTDVAYSVTASTGGTGDIFEFGFEDGTSGGLINSSVQAFIGNGPWTLENTLAARGVNSVKQVYNASTGNVGSPFFKTITPGRTSVYVRAMYRQSNPFNQSGATNNFDQVKLIRVLGPSFAGIFGSFYISNSLNSSPGQLLMTFADLEGNQQHPPNVNLPAPNFNSLLNTWICVEGHWDITVSNALRLEGWINGVKHFDYTIAQPNQSRLYGVVQFNGTINSMQQQSTAWFDSIGIGTQFMGVP